MSFIDKAKQVADDVQHQVKDAKLMEKAKAAAEEVQAQVKDGTLKEKAKAAAEQAQAKFDEVQEQIAEKRHKGGGEPPADK